MYNVYVSMYNVYVSMYNVNELKITSKTNTHTHKQTNKKNMFKLKLSITFYILMIDTQFSLLRII